MKVMIRTSSKLPKPTMMVVTASLVLACSSGSPASGGGSGGKGGADASSSGGASGAGGADASSDGGASGASGGASGASGGNGGATSQGGRTGASGGASSGGAGAAPGDGAAPSPSCAPGKSGGAVQKPVFVRNLPGETSWFASPIVRDLDHDGKNELVAAYYSLFVYDAAGKQLAKASDGKGRIYAPHVVTDLEGDGTTDIVFGNDKNVFAYEWKGRALSLKAGWPVDTTTGGSSPEVRGLAAADLDGDGKIEIVATTTQTVDKAQGGSQVFVYSADGTSYQPKGVTWPAWPRYNNLTGQGGDADRNGQGESGYGCYGLNVGIGNIDDDPDLEILVTYDNHQIQAFDPNGVTIDSSPWFKNPSSKYAGQRMTWGQFIRWADPAVETNHYHLNTGTWPSPDQEEWLQWTASPPSVADLDGDGKNEVIGVPNVEKQIPYVTQAFALMVLEGAYGDGSQSAMRMKGWETLPRGGAPLLAPSYYPPLGVPAPAIVSIQGDSRPEIVVSLNDGFTYAFDGTSKLLWKFDHRFGKPLMYASEATIADLNQDGSPEVVFSTFGDPDTTDSGHLVVLSASGALLFDVPLPSPGHNGNGNGGPAAPTIADLDGNGTLEIFVQTFDHGMDEFTVPGSGTACVL
jgi:hypothetical protein